MANGTDGIVARDTGVASDQAADEENFSLHVTRRQALVGSAAALAAIALEADPASALEPGANSSALDGARSTVSFDEGWRFHYGDAPGADAPTFDDGSWRALDVPHDWRIEDLPYATSDDGGASSDPSGFAHITNPAIMVATPRQIGPFDADRDPTPAIAGNNHGQGYTVSTVGWYRKHFTLSATGVGGPTGKATGRHFELMFDGVYQNADVWLNGKHLGFHPYGYTPFSVDLTPHLDLAGPNVLSVRVDASGHTSRYYAGSGIYRHTRLTAHGPVHIPKWGTKITTPVVDERRSIARVDVPVSNQASGNVQTHVRVTVLDGRGRTIAKRTARAQRIDAGKSATFAVNVPITPAALWSPESPNLYSARTEVLVGDEVVDSDAQPFGIRSIEVSGQHGFRLNGKQIKMRGGCVHHDHGALGAVSLYRSEERRVEILKSLGFNAIRTSHNPPSQEMLDACDRLGMLVYEEYTDMWDAPPTTQERSTGYYEYFPDWWERDLTAMVTRDRNRACVVMWSLGNQVSDENNYGARLAALVRSLDNSRPLGISGYPDEKAYAYSDFGDLHYVADYSSDRAAHPDKAMVQGESFPPDVYRFWKLCQDNAFAIGDFVWTAWDYIGETSVGAPPLQPTGQSAVGDAYGLGAAAGALPYPWYQAFCGDVDLIGQRKPQSYWRSVVWGLSPLEMAVERPPPPGFEQRDSKAGGRVWGYFDELQSWTWDVSEGQAMKARVYTSGDSVKLLLNRKEIGTNQLAESDQLRTTFSVPYEPGELTAVAYKSGREIGRKTFTTAGEPAALRLTSDVDELTTSRDDLAHLVVEVVDAQGRPVPDAVVKVNFAIDGGKLAGVANGNPRNVDSFRRPRRWTYQGKALAIVHPPKIPGSLSVIASAEGLRPATVTLAVVPVVPVAADVGESLKVQYFGARSRLGGVLVTLAAPGRTLRGVTVEMRRGKTLYARSGKHTLTGRRRRVVLRRRRRAVFSPGRYTLIVRQGKTVLQRRTVRVHKHRLRGASTALSVAGAPLLLMAAGWQALIRRRNQHRSP